MAAYILNNGESITCGGLMSDIIYTSYILVYYTVEPPNKGHVGTKSFVLYREVSFNQRLKCTGRSLFGVSFIRGSTVPQIWHVKAHDYTLVHHDIILVLVYHKWNVKVHDIPQM